MPATTIIMPKLGESVAEGTIERWLKAEGETVQQDEPLVEVATDKVTAEMPSPLAGTLVKILVQPGQAVPVNTPIALIEPGDGARKKTRHPPTPAVDQREIAANSVSSPHRHVPTRADSPPPLLTPPPHRSIAPAERASASREEMARRRSTPLVRRLAAKYGVSLDAVPGSGFGGRVRREDLLAFLDQHEQPERSTAGEPAGVASAASYAALGSNRAAAAPEALPGEAQGEASLLPLTVIRRVIAERMTQSRLHVPAATTVFEVDMTGIVRRRAAVRDEFHHRTGVDLSYLPFAVRATVEALVAVPAVNVSFTPEGILAHRDIHIGLAVALEGGAQPGGDALVVPVLRHADRLSMAGLARALDDLVTRARAGKLGADELVGATFTVNNTGALGSVISTPIVPHPQAAIMTMEAIVKRPVVLTDADGNDSIAIRSMLYACLSFDHRAFDGYSACRFMRAVKTWLEAAGPACDLY